MHETIQSSLVLKHYHLVAQTCNIYADNGIKYGDKHRVADNFYNLIDLMMHTIVYFDCFKLVLKENRRHTFMPTIPVIKSKESINIANVLLFVHAM